MKALLKKLWWRLNTSRKCSWCGKVTYRSFGERLHLGRVRVSHGLCDECFGAAMAALEVERQNPLTARQKGAKVNL